MSVETVLGVFAVPTFATALELAGGAVELADHSFAAALEAASARQDQLLNSDLDVPELDQSPVEDLVESALDGVRRHLKRRRPVIGGV